MASSETSTNSNSTTLPIQTLNFDVLQKKPRLSISYCYDFYFFSHMTANDKYLLYCPAGYLSLLDKQGIEKYRISNSANIMDVHWSSYLNQFLILNQYGSINGLYLTTSGREQSNIVKKFGENMITFACYEEILLMCTDFIGSVIYEYDLSNWTLKRTFKPLASCKKHESILKMRFNSNGKRLVFVLNERDHPNFLYWIELRQSSDLAVLQILKLGNENGCYNVLSLPNDQFLVNQWEKERKFYLINSSNSEVAETISYDTNTQIQSTALIDGQCLVLQIGENCRSGELLFYDL
jgi:hypothetical protein